MKLAGPAFPATQEALGPDRKGVAGFTREEVIHLTLLERCPSGSDCALVHPGSQGTLRSSKKKKKRPLNGVLNGRIYFNAHIQLHETNYLQKT